MISFETLDESDVSAAFDLATETFAQGSTLHRALGVGLDEYRAYLRPSFQQMAEEGMSVIARDGEGRLLGCLIVTEYRVEDSSRLSPPFDALAGLAKALDAQYRKACRVAAGDAVLVDMAAVALDARGMGLYGRMRREAESFALAKGYRLILGELSSVATQHFVLEKLGHKKRAEVMFDEFTYQGAKPFAGIKAPRSVILAEGEL